MLPWSMTFHAARLGLEAQNAMAFRFFRLVGDTFGLMADSKIDSVDGIVSPLKDLPAPLKAASNGGRTRASVSKAYKKQVRKRTKRSK